MKITGDEELLFNLLNSTVVDSFNTITIHPNGDIELNFVNLDENYVVGNITDRSGLADELEEISASYSYAYFIEDDKIIFYDSDIRDQHCPQLSWAKGYYVRLAIKYGIYDRIRNCLDSFDEDYTNDTTFGEILHAINSGEYLYYYVLRPFKDADLTDIHRPTEVTNRATYIGV